MVTRTQLTTACETLEAKLQELGFVFRDIQFDAAAETLSIILDNDSQRRLPPLTGQNPANGATIDARVLWNVLRDLIKLGVMNPAIQLRKQNRDQPQTRQPIECEGSRREH
jgi:hypothetical protein